MSSFKNKIVVGDVVVDVVRKDIKNLHLRVRPPQGKVHVTAPYRITDYSIRSFLMSKLDWIKKHQLKFEGLQNQLELEYISGENHPYQGKSYLLNVIYYEASADYGTKACHTNSSSSNRRYIFLCSNSFFWLHLNIL